MRVVSLTFRSHCRKRGDAVLGSLGAYCHERKSFRERVRDHNLPQSELHLLFQRAHEELPSPAQMDEGAPHLGEVACYRRRRRQYPHCSHAMDRYLAIEQGLRYVTFDAEGRRPCETHHLDCEGLDTIPSCASRLVLPSASPDHGVHCCHDSLLVSSHEEYRNVP